MPEKEVSVDSVRDQLRVDICRIALLATAFDIESRIDEKKAALYTADNMARFGYITGLFSMAELNDWQGAITTNEPSLNHVMDKYIEDDDGEFDEDDE